MLCQKLEVRFIRYISWGYKQIQKSFILAALQNSLTPELKIWGLRPKIK
jgi:hypothetical protein